MSQEKIIPKGRGGRGAAILQALDQFKNYPGHPSNLNGPDTTLTKPMGRAKFLDNALQISLSEGLKNSSYNPMKPNGRGNLIANLQKKKEKYPNSDYDPIKEEEKKDDVIPESLSKNKYEDEEKQDLDKLSDYIMKIRLREIDKTGTSGNEVPLTANYISLSVKPGQSVYIYCIKFEPQVDSKDFRFRIIKQQAKLFGEYRSFDGSLLFLPHALYSNNITINVNHPFDNSTIEMNIKLVAKRQVHECRHLLNILFKKIMLNLQMVRFGKYLYDPSIASEIPQYRLEVWPGLISSVSVVDGGIQVCCDSTHRILRTQTVYEMIKELMVANPKNYKTECLKKLLGSSVLTRYNNKLYRIDDILWDTSPKGTFQISEDKEISFIDYYFKNYNITIIDENQPLLISKHKSTNNKTEIMICIIPELCYMTGLTQDMRDDFHLMKNLASHANMTPQQRLHSFQKFFDQIRETPTCVKLLNGWGLSLMPETVRILARQLNPENIILGNNQAIITKNSEWQVNRQLYAPVQFKHWIIIHLYKDSQIIHGFVAHIKKIAPHFGLRMQSPRIIQIQDEKIETYVKILKKEIKIGVQLVVVITPTNRGDRYSVIKKICCVENPIPSQVILTKTLSTKLSLVTPKILFQMNCKLGGSTWGVHIPYKKVMVCGIDSYHSADTRGSSVGAFVSSLNSECTKWFSHVDFQGAKIEFLNSLTSFMTVALKEYFNANKFLPERIIIYRDGVGNGQLNMCQEYEIPQLYEGIKLYLNDYKPQMTYIICQKRINTRFFLRQSNGVIENPGSGTVVDNTVTNPDLFDFFLISQKVKRGTVFPTHYIVIHNKSTMTPDQIQKFTYKMTYLYYNSNSVVRVPAACQYAHKLAHLVGQYIKVSPSKLLSDKLYYL